MVFVVRFSCRCLNPRLSKRIGSWDSPTLVIRNPFAVGRLGIDRDSMGILYFWFASGRRLSLLIPGKVQLACSKKYRPQQ